MKKVYHYEVEGLDPISSNSSLIQSIIDEANSEVRQLKLTIKINQATSKQLTKVFHEYHEELVSQLSALNVQMIDRIQFSRSTHNHRLNSITQIFGFDEKRFKMVMYPLTDKHEDTKYSPTQGRYRMDYICAENGYNTELYSLEEFIGFWRSTLIRHYKKTTK